MVSGLQITLIVDGRSVCCNFHNLDKIQEIMRDGGSLGGFLRRLAEAPMRIPNHGETMDVKVGGGIGDVKMQGGIIVPGRGGRS